MKKIRIFKKIIGSLFFLGLLFFSVKIYLKEDIKETTEEIETNIDSSVLKEEEQMWEDIESTSVQIRGDNIFGSGSIYNMDEETIYIVSNKHLTIYVMNPVVYFFDGSTAKGINTKNAEQIDMGIFEVKKEDVSKETLDMIKKIKILEENLNIEVKMEVYADGGIEGTIVNTSEYHPEFHSNMVRCKGIVESGMSGMGVFNSELNYLGMISGAKDEEFLFLPVELMIEEEYFGGSFND